MAGDTEVGLTGPISKNQSAQLAARISCDDSPESDAEAEEVVAPASEALMLYPVHSTVIDVID